MLSAVFHGGPAREIVFTGFIGEAFVLHSCYVFVRGLPTLLAMVECLFAPTSPTLSCLHRVTLASVFLTISNRVFFNSQKRYGHIYKPSP